MSHANAASSKVCTLSKMVSLLIFFKQANTNSLLTLFHTLQHFFSFFKTLIGKTIIVELKNELALKGALSHADTLRQYKTRAQSKQAFKLFWLTILPFRRIAFCRSIPQHQAHWHDRCGPPKISTLGISLPTLSWCICCWFLTVNAGDVGGWMHSTQFIDMSHTQVAVNNCFIRGSVVRYIQVPHNTHTHTHIHTYTQSTPSYRYSVNAICRWWWCEGEGSHNSYNRGDTLP